MILKLKQIGYDLESVAKFWKNGSEVNNKPFIGNQMRSRETIQRILSTTLSSSIVKWKL